MAVAPSQPKKMPLGRTGPLILALVFLVALVLAANNNTILGWFIAFIAFGWLVLATAVYVGLVKAARFGAAQVARLGGAGAPPASGSVIEGAVTAEVDEADDAVTAQNRLKVDHSLTIIEVQTRVIDEHLDRYAERVRSEVSAEVSSTDPNPPRDVIKRALGTIQATTRGLRDLGGL